MVELDKRDREIIFFIDGHEVFFREIQEKDLMAKSTLSKHLKHLMKGKFIDKKISKTRARGQSCVVYYLTKKGKKVLRENSSDINDWF